MKMKNIARQGTNLVFQVPVLAMETKPSELGEMEDESLVAQVPCEPGVGLQLYPERYLVAQVPCEPGIVTTAVPREVISMYEDEEYC